jgi:hypothetical protein
MCHSVEFASRSCLTCAHSAVTKFGMYFFTSTLASYSINKQVLFHPLSHTMLQVSHGFALYDRTDLLFFLHGCDTRSSEDQSLFYISCTATAQTTTLHLLCTRIVVEAHVVALFSPHVPTISDHRRWPKLKLKLPLPGPDAERLPSCSTSPKCLR